MTRFASPAIREVARALAYAGAALLWCALFAVLAGCALTTPLTHPVGGTLTCRTWGWGWAGFPLALVDHQWCIARAEQRGLVAGETTATFRLLPP